MSNFLYFPEDAAQRRAGWVHKTGQRGWSFTLLGVISDANFGGAQFSEVHSAASRVQYGDAGSWWSEWSALAERLDALARGAEREGHLVTARDRYLRAGNYFRVAEFWLEHDDERLQPTYDRSVDAFRRGFALSEPEIEPVAIPYENTSLPGYFVPTPLQRNRPAPTVVFFGGADTTAEGLYFKSRGLGLRGMNVLLVDGPGQGRALRKQGLVLRHDWEVPAGAAFDFAAARDDVDADAIALMGMSLGGYLAPRAAAFDKRFAACVCWAIHHDVYEFWRARPDDHPLVHHWKWLMGKPDMAGVRESLKQYRLADVLGQIECPVLVTMGEDEGEFRLEQARRSFDELRCEKTFKLFTSDETGSAHCQIDNILLANEVIGDWLSDILARQRRPAASN